MICFDMNQCATGACINSTCRYPLPPQPNPNNGTNNSLNCDRTGKINLCDGLNCTNGSSCKSNYCLNMRCFTPQVPPNPTQNPNNNNNSSNATCSRQGNSNLCDGVKCS
jgi:hypothetical protein